MQLAATSGLDALRLLDWCAVFAEMSALELASQGATAHKRIEILLTLAARAAAS